MHVGAQQNAWYSLQWVLQPSAHHTLSLCSKFPRGQAGDPEHHACSGPGAAAGEPLWMPFTVGE